MIKIFFKICKDYYIILSSIIVVLSTAICLWYSNEYLSLFDIDFFAFSGISDSYQISISKGIIFPIFILLFFIILSLVSTVASIRGRNNDVQKGSHPIATLQQKIIGTFLVCLGWGIIIFVTFSTWFYSGILPEQQAKPIKVGQSARYNIIIGSEKFLCHSIIAGTSSYLFLWDFSNKRSKIVSRSKITYLDQVVPLEPSTIAPSDRTGFMGRRRMSDSEYAIIKEKISQTHLAWSALLKNECFQ